MSAHIVGTDLIDLLVTVALEGPPHSRGLRVWHGGEVHYFDGYTDRDAGQRLGEILITANVASVNYRYQETTPAPAWTFRRVSHVGGESRAVIPWGHVLNACHCFDYQSCETPTWRESFAYAIIDAIIHKVCDRIASDTDAPWEWTRDTARERENATRAALMTGGK